MGGSRGREGGRRLTGKHSGFQRSVHQGANDGSGGGRKVLLVDDMVGGTEGGTEGGRGGCRCDECGKKEGGVLRVERRCHFDEAAGGERGKMGGGMKLIRGGIFSQGSKETKGEREDFLGY